MISWFNRRLRKDREDGAALVEFAVVLPLFILLIFGVMETGWFFAQNIEVRNAAREGARLAAVDFPTPGGGDEIAIRDATCTRAPLASASANVSLAYDSVADTATVTVKQAYLSLTGLINVFDGNVESTVVMRFERDDPPTWGPLTDSACP
jgi:Flp pilus assembly protein TadG